METSRRAAHKWRTTRLRHCLLHHAFVTYHASQHHDTCNDCSKTACYNRSFFTELRVERIKKVHHLHCSGDGLHCWLWSAKPWNQHHHSTRWLSLKQILVLVLISFCFRCIMISTPFPPGCLGYKSRILVSLRVFMTKRHYFLAAKVSFRVHSKKSFLGLISAAFSNPVY